MKTIIAGGRKYILKSKDFLILDKEKENITEVVCGGATGVDECGKIWALYNNIPVKEFLADWFRKGKIAGFIRNTEMAEYSDKLIAFWDGKSPGTKNMIKTATDMNLIITIIRTDKQLKKPTRSLVN